MSIATSGSGGERNAAIDFVDAHHHFQDLSANSYPWLQGNSENKPLAGDLSTLQINYLAADLRRDLAGLNLLKSVHIQNGWNPSDPAGETRWLQAESEKTGLANAIVGFANLADPGAEALLGAHAAFPNFRGIRQILKWHALPELTFASRPDIIDSFQWRAGYALLRRFGLSFDAQLHTGQLNSLARLAAEYSDIVLVVNHAGMPIDRSPEGLSFWVSALEALAARPNVNIKLSGVGLYGGLNWSRDAMAALLLRIIDVFGIERCMFGSNLPVERLTSSPGALVDLIGSIGSRFAPDEADALRRRNAERIYRI